MKLHDLQPPSGAHKPPRRVGRGHGSGRGKTAGRGTKGQKSRAGASIPAWFEGGQTPLHVRTPKLHGFKNRFRTEYQVVNLDRVAELFPQGGTIGVEDLVAKGAVRDNQLVKVLGGGDFAVKVDITAHAFSASAKEKITAAGGTATQL